MSSASPATKERLRKEKEEADAAAAGAAKGRTSRTPSRSARRRGRSTVRRSDGNEIIVHERTVQERAAPSSSIVWPMLT
jgi:hypothetical protein